MSNSPEAAASIPSEPLTVPQQKSCWSCHAVLDTGAWFCGECGRIQPLPRSSDYFEVLSLPRKLNLDVTALQREFYRLSRLLHPDVFARATQQEQEQSLANSSLLNDAYRALKDPIRRTEYLLEIEKGVNSDAGGGKEDRVPADLLEEVFELNMQLEEMRMNRQTGATDPRLQADLLAAKGNFDVQLAATDATLAKLWERWDAAMDSGDTQRKQSVRSELGALLDRRRYIRNLVNSVNDALTAEQ